MNGPKDYKVRVYILTCQNLAAVDSYVEFKNMLAGDQANSSADPYIKLKVGSGVQDETD